jgi:exonuclease VII small subunit
MGEIKQTFTSDISDLENKLAKLQSEQLKLKDKMRETAREGKRGHDEFNESLRGSIAPLTGLVTKYASLGAGVAALNQAYAEYHERVKASAEAQERLNQAQIAGQTKAGLLQQGPAVDAALNAIIRQGATREQAQAALFGVGEGGANLTLPRRKDIAESVARLAPMGSTEDLKSVAQIAGRVAEFLPDKSPTEITSLVETMRTRVGAARAEQLTSRQFMGGVRALAESGAATPEEALGLATTAMMKDVSPQLLERVFSKVAAPMSAPKRHPGRAPTPKEIAEERFASASKAERLNLLLSDEDVQEAVAGERLAGRLGRLAPGDIAAETARLTAAEGRDVIGDELSALGQTKAGRRVLHAQGLASERDVRSAGRADEGLAWQDLDALVERKLADSGASTMGYYMRKTDIGLSHGAAMFNEWATQGKFGQWLFGVDEQMKYTPEAVMKQSASVAGPRAMFSDEDIKSFSEQQKELNSTLKTNQATNAAVVAQGNHNE